MLFADIASVSTQVIEATTEALSSGTNIPKATLNQLKHVFEALDLLLQEADQNIAQLQAEIVSTDSLNSTTVQATELIKILIDNFEETNDFIRIQFDLMEELVDETLKTLKEAKQKYNNAIHNLEKSSTQLSTTKAGIDKMLDSRSAEYKTWTTKVRTGTYGGCGALTAGTLVADFLGCSGKLNQSIPSFPLIL